MLLYNIAGDIFSHQFDVRDIYKDYILDKSTQKEPGSQVTITRKNGPNFQIYLKLEIGSKLIYRVFDLKI
jgi:hypothetical protein